MNKVDKLKRRMDTMQGETKRRIGMGNVDTINELIEFYKNNEICKTCIKLSVQVGTVNKEIESLKDKHNRLIHLLDKILILNPESTEKIKELKEVLLNQ